MSLRPLAAAKPDAKEVSIEDMLIGTSAPMTALRDMVRRVARSSASVMICGASGTCKEGVARAIHAASARSEKPYVALNCGAIPAERIESELFGHERGAFAGARTRRIGHFENADTGTLFLDEIGDMRADMQVKLLRILEDGLVSRLGGSRALPVDVRIISATHHNIDHAVTEGRFREDLFFRLGVVLLQLPELAARAEDIPPLIAHFQKGTSAATACHFDRSAIARLMTYSWPGNVRELHHVVERADVLFPGHSIDAVGVDQLLGRAAPAVAPRPEWLPLDAPIDLKAQLERLELERIEIALSHAGGIISEAARLLTLKRTTLIEKMRKYGVERLAA
jgi:sigma-54 specific flagellar transcriptional regulator A